MNGFRLPNWLPAMQKPTRDADNQRMQISDVCTPLIQFMMLSTFRHVVFDGYSRSICCLTFMRNYYLLIKKLAVNWQMKHYWLDMSAVRCFRSSVFGILTGNSVIINIKSQPSERSRRQMTVTLRNAYGKSYNASENFFAPLCLQ